MRIRTDGSRGWMANRNINIILRLSAALIVLLTASAPRIALGGDQPSENARPADTTAVRYRAEGIASWYGRRFNGRKTASGERFNRHALTCAHRTLPFGTIVKVTNIETGDQITVRVNDRGPYVRDRIIDLSDAAAKAIGIQGCGIVHIETCGDVEEPVIARKPMQIERHCAKRRMEKIEQIEEVDTILVAGMIIPDSTLDTLSEQVLPITPASYHTAFENAYMQRYTSGATCSMGVRIVDTNDVPLDVHGYTVVVASTNRYSEAVDVRETLLARGYHTVNLVIARTCGENHYKVCVGMEPVPFACRRAEEFLSRDYPTTSIVYIDNIDDDQDKATARAY